MPKIANELPEVLKPYVGYGVDLQVRGSEAVADCFLCGKEGKWYVNCETGLWHCKVCGEKGNPLEFVRKLWEAADQGGSCLDEYEALGTSRVLDMNTLVSWGVRFSPLTGEPILPGYDARGNVCQLYRYSVVKGKRVLLATTGLDHGIHAANMPNKTHKRVYVCEGPWDGMVLWQVLARLKEDGDGGYVNTANHLACMLRDVCVLAVPGCNVWKDEWAGLLAGKEVVLLYDNDHPQPHPTTGNMMEPVGWQAMRRVCERLATSDEQPASVSCIHWGPEGYDHDLKSGWDVCDVFGHIPNEGEALGHLLALVEPIPQDWVAGRSPGSRKGGKLELQPLDCPDWRTLVNAWKLAMKWTEGLDRALSVMIATVLSTKMAGDHLWVKVVSPPSTGKSVLCEALGVSKKHVVCKSTMRGFHSGFKDGDKDTSLLTLIKDKTLVTKDGDTLLQAPNLPQILSEARDIYDRVSRTHYRNGVQNDYPDLNITWLLCGTASLRRIDSSELGERFLDCVIMGGIDPDLEDDILDRHFNKAVANACTEVNGSPTHNEQPEMVRAKRLTGGYIDRMKPQVAELAAAVTWSDDSRAMVKSLAKFVSYTRARPSKLESESADRELAARLLSQLIRLAQMLCVVLNKTTVDGEVMQRVHRTALDTARGATLDMMVGMQASGDRGVTLDSLSILTHGTTMRTQALLTFLKRLGAVEHFNRTTLKGARDGIMGGGAKAWRLTPRVAELYDKVMNNH